MPICWREAGASRFTDLRRLRPDTTLIQELKTLTRDQESLIVSQTRQVESAHRLPQKLLPRSADLIGARSSGLPPWHSFKPTQRLKRQSKLRWKTSFCFSSRPSIGAWPASASGCGNNSTSPPMPPDAITTRAKSRLMLALVQQLLRLA
jgi:hypothetical protein